MEKLNIAYQLYSARDCVQQDMAGTMKVLATMGYGGVEFAGFFGHGATEISGMLMDAGLIPLSSHVPYNEIAEDMFGVISYHKKIGIQYIAVPYLDESLRPGSSGFSGAIRTIRSFGSLCRQAGITLLYHNHDFEFCRISGEYGLDFLYAAIPPEDLQTELDTCWVKYAGEDPASYIRKYAGRCPVVHLKDYAGGKGGSTPYALIGKEDSAVKTNNATFQFRPLGYGCQDIPSLVVAGLESGAKWFVVEQDLPLEGKPLEDARKSIDTLLKIG